MVHFILTIGLLYWIEFVYHIVYKKSTHILDKQKVAFDGFFNV